MKLIRWLLGRIILLVNALTPPKSLQRTPERQQQVDKQTQSLALYQFEACPFCVKVRRQIKRLGLGIELRDAKNDLQHQAELQAGGGRVKVPCLRIDQRNEQGEIQTIWMYESSDINAYLAKEFAN
ncbi:glutaredoxin family protein [Motilimonas eburnea]|uniref:glutaredoxin family protein n=1 Tax=Motilimonas eburnea TaxID=1737488 RepID=UPI001E6191B1|nr:glutaredoxin [Motilimonas eburnea]MCE2570515.1 glutaredoxin [Motilimonas eburnea]